MTEDHRMSNRGRSGRVAVVALGLLLGLPPGSAGAASMESAGPPPELDDDALATVARVVGDVTKEDEGFTDLAEDSVLAGRHGPVYVDARLGGRRIGEGWGDGGTWAENLADAVRTARSDFGGETPDVVVACLAHSARAVPLRPGEGAFTNVHRGVTGVELRSDETRIRVCPTEMISRNIRFDHVLEDFADVHGWSEGELFRSGAQALVFEARQVYVELVPEPDATSMFRGNQVVPLEAVTRDGVERLQRELGDWMIRQVDEDGRLTYKYWPSRSEESSANNMIRQFMGTIALGRLARYRTNPSIHELSRKNLHYDFDRFYREENDLGFVQWRGKVKLGAVALAALAIVEHPSRQEFERQERAFRRFIDRMAKPDGSFETFYKPAGRSGNQNFYPGETLLLWSTLYRQDPDPDLLGRFRKSFRYYKDWHLRNRNPAFIPWHTQADYAVWKETKDPELRDFIFRMNDWLLDVQQWEDVPYPDLRGRFYDPDRPFGPPHASSTGVYLEGLIDAFRLAREVGDRERAERYRLAIRRGLRSVMQLEFADEIDMFYVSDRDRVHGGVRETVYDNEIRVDNVQHNLMAILKILEYFSDEDFS